MTKRAWVFVYGVLVAGLLVTACAILFQPAPAASWQTFIFFAGLAMLAQLFGVNASPHQTYYATLIFIFAALLLLSPSQFVLLVLAAYGAEWVKERLLKTDNLTQWYLQPFNISTIMIAGLVSHAPQLLMGTPQVLFATWHGVLLVMLEAGGFLCINHMLVGLAVVLARNKNWREVGSLDKENLLMDLVLLLLGYTVAVMWQINAWLIPAALSPLILIYRSLMIPQLKKEAQTDEKTGLWNARHFARLFSSELDRARRFDRPLALLMADLDLLRNINNTYGHLAGDQVLKQIGELIAKSVRDYDIAGRFGGEEFCIALPETEMGEAWTMAERLRQRVEMHDFVVRTSPTPIHITMSIGIACHPQDALGAMQLIHAADIAVYQAKLLGRNCSVLVSEVPPSIRTAHTIGDDRLASYNVTFAQETP